MHSFTKRISLASLLLFCGAYGAMAQLADNTYKAQLDSLFQGFKSQDYAFVKPMLDSKVTIGTLPKGMNDAVVPQVLKQLPAPTAYTTDAITKEEGGTRVSTTYTYPGGATRKQSFLFNAAGKITDFDVLGGTQTMTATAATPTSMPNAFEVPFELHEHIIFVKALLNGKEEEFILDSGAPTFILNSDETKGTTVQSTGAMAVGVGGAASVGATHIESFDWHGLKLGASDVITMSLKHLEKQAGHSFAGLIGYTVFQDYELTFDYARKVITFAKVNDAGEPVAPREELAKASSIVPIKMQQHIPVFTMTIEGKEYHMGLDCGAGSNLLYAKYQDDVKASIGDKQRARISGAGSDKVKAQAATIKAAIVGNTTYKNMLFAFEDATLDQVNNGYNLGIDGLLGYEFLKQYKTTVNFKKGELRIYQ